MIKAFHSQTHALHAPTDDAEDGLWFPFIEVPERIEAVLAALVEIAEIRLIEAKPATEAHLAAVHDRRLIGSLRQISKGLGPDEVYQPNLYQDRIFLDQSSPVLRGTFQAACGAAGCALEAAGAVEAGDKLSIALCRPPGHHAGRAFCGGYCYFNNAALAAQHLTAQGRVGILDLDFHHGHGTQDIFYQRSDVAYASLHADPSFEYPYRWGYAHETGAGAGEGYNLNLPLPLDCREEEYLEALDRAAEFLAGHGIRSLVVSLGFDTHSLDPYSGLGLNEHSYQKIGAAIAKLALPTVVAFEGGYKLSVLGPSWTAFIDGWRTNT